MAILNYFKENEIVTIVTVTIVANMLSVTPVSENSYKGVVTLYHGEHT